MKPIDRITNAERKLHAAKGRLKALRNRRWIDENYKQKKSDLESEIQQTEKEIIQYRCNLQQLYNQHLNA